VQQVDGAARPAQLERERELLDQVVPTARDLGEDSLEDRALRDRAHQQRRDRGRDEQRVDEAAQGRGLGVLLAEVEGRGGHDQRRLLVLDDPGQVRGRVPLHEPPLVARHALHDRARLALLTVVGRVEQEAHGHRAAEPLLELRGHRAAGDRPLGEVGEHDEVRDGDVFDLDRRDHGPLKQRLELVELSPPHGRGFYRRAARRRWPARPETGGGSASSTTTAPAGVYVAPAPRKRSKGS